MSYQFLLNIAMILMSTKLLGLLTKRFEMPQVVGALLAGLILGPAYLDVLHETEFIERMAELGVIVLMFSAGVDTDLREMRKVWKCSLLVSVIGILMAFFGGVWVAYLFNRGELSGEGANIALQNIFIGVILASTSVSITVETLKELGKMNTKVGNAILGAALIDDVIGIISLTIVMSMADSSVNVGIVLLNIVMFFVFASIAGVVFYKAFDIWVRRHAKDHRRFVIIAFVMCLLLAYIAEEFFGVAGITGAFIAGLIVSKTPSAEYIESRFETLSYMLLSPIFFASIGIKVVLPQMSTSLLLFGVLIIGVAIVSKVVGCMLGAKLRGFENKSALQVGVGMISRGEVSLIIASKGASLGLVNEKFMAPIVIMVVVTTIITPILLKIVFKEKGSAKVVGG